MDYPSAQIERAYWLAWPMIHGNRSEEQIATRLIAGGVPKGLAHHVAEDVARRRHRHIDSSRDNLFSFGVFMLGLGLLVFLITFLITKSAIVLPHLLILGGGVTVAGLARRVHIE